ncbi:MAG: C40 family peptidase [Streptosporangiales bacterium]|nr:C40 family peptidase [Streptosporangiales bacterium]MBO0891675.1 C40 family peptidase [Acidothermales bacterium]
MSPAVPRSRVVPLLGRLVTGALVVALVVTTGPGVATTAPKPNIHTVQRQVDALGRKVDVLAEQYDVARIRLAAAQRRSAAATKRVRTQQAAVEQLRKKIAALATSAYMGGPTDVASLVTARSPQDFVDKSASLELLSEQDKRQVSTFTKASKQLSSQRTDAAKALAEQRTETAKIGHTRATIMTLLGKQKRVLAQLQKQAAAKRAKQLAQQRAQAAAAARAAQQAKERARQRASRAAARATSSPSKSSAPSAPSAPANPPSGSGNVSAVIAYAQAQIGKPYEWGADGPDSFDCSGLTMMAWKQAGVSLPHSSQLQYSEGGPHVSKSQLRPGDLVFFYQPISHVALYVGNGRMITAPQTGENVKYADLGSSYYQSNYTGAVRPG